MDALVQDRLADWQSVVTEDSVQSVVSESPSSKKVNEEIDETTALEAVTRRQLVKIQQTEKS
jgi:hypothetical protein